VKFGGWHMVPAPRAQRTAQTVTGITSPAGSRSTQHAMTQHALAQ